MTAGDHSGAPDTTPTATSDDLWVWTRFRAHLDDWRPIYKTAEGHPGLGPYWCSGYGEDYSVICAWVRPGQDVRRWWPEAEQITQEQPMPMKFSDRFPEPEWWTEQREGPHA
jgi:hypothetical protein